MHRLIKGQWEGGEGEAGVVKGRGDVRKGAYEKAAERSRRAVSVGPGFAVLVHVREDGVQVVEEQELLARRQARAVLQLLHMGDTTSRGQGMGMERRHVSWYDHHSQGGSDVLLARHPPSLPSPSPSQTHPPRVIISSHYLSDERDYLIANLTIVSRVRTYLHALGVVEGEVERVGDVVQQHVHVRDLHRLAVPPRVAHHQPRADFVLVQQLCHTRPRQTIKGCGSEGGLESLHCPWADITDERAEEISGKGVSSVLISYYLCCWSKTCNCIAGVGGVPVLPGSSS